MFAANDEEMLALDQADVLEILRMRFHTIPAEIVNKIKAIRQLDVLQRLILVAANAADWQVFLEELREGETSFRLLGERFDPTEHTTRRG
jgi:hypothetical protein